MTDDDVKHFDERMAALTEEDELHCEQFMSRLDWDFGMNDAERAASYPQRAALDPNGPESVWIKYVVKDGEVLGTTG